MADESSPLAALLSAAKSLGPDLKGMQTAYKAVASDVHNARQALSDLLDAHKKMDELGTKRSAGSLGRAVKALGPDLKDMLTASKAVTSDVKNAKKALSDLFGTHAKLNDLGAKTSKSSLGKAVKALGPDLKSMMTASRSVISDVKNAKHALSDLFDAHAKMDEAGATRSKRALGSAVKALVPDLKGMLTASKAVISDVKNAKQALSDLFGTHAKLSSQGAKNSKGSQNNSLHGTSAKAGKLNTALREQHKQVEKLHGKGEKAHAKSDAKPHAKSESASKSAPKHSTLDQILALRSKMESSGHKLKNAGQWILKLTHPQAQTGEQASGAEEHAVMTHTSGKRENKLQAIQKLSSHVGQHLTHKGAHASSKHLHAGGHTKHAHGTGAQIPVDPGLAGYQEVRHMLATQTSLQARINKQSHTLKVQWTATNKLFEETFAGAAPLLKPVLDWLAQDLQKVTEKVQAWVKEHPGLLQGIQLTGEYLGGLLNSMGDLLLNMSELLEPFSKLKSILEEFGPTIESFKDTWNVASKALKDFSPNIAHTLQTGLNAGKGVLKNFASATGQVWDTVLGGSKKAITGMSQKIGELGGTLKQAGGRAWEGLSGVASKAWDKALSVCKTGGAATGQALSAFASTTQNIAGTAMNGLSTAVSGIASVVSAGWSRAVQLLAAGWTTITTAISASTSFLMANPIILVIAGIAVAALLIWKYWEPIKNFFVGVWQSVSSAFSKFSISASIAPITKAAQSLMQYWQPIKSFFMGIWNQVKTAFSGGIQGIAKLILNWSPLGLIYRAWAGVLSWFGVSLPAKFTDFGKHMMSGMVNGIMHGLTGVKDAVLNVGSSAVRWFKDKLGIKSPSRVFTELGHFTMQGLNVGMDAGQHGPLQTLSNFSRRLVAAGTVGIAAPAFAAAQYASPIQGNAAHSSTATSSISINIHAAPGMDEKAIARQVAIELERWQRNQKARSRARLGDLD